MIKKLELALIQIWNAIINKYFEAKKNNDL